MDDSDLIHRIQEHYANRLPLGTRWSDPGYIYSWRNPIGYYQRERVRRALVTMLNRQRVDLSNGWWLDIGCGTGDWLRFIAELRGTCGGLVGVDLSPDSLRRGQLINACIPTGNGDARHLAFADGVFHFVSQFVTFEHLLAPPDLIAASAEVERVCAPGAWLIWHDILPVKSDYQRGFTLADVRTLFPGFRVAQSQKLFRHLMLPGRTLCTSDAVPRRSYLIAELIEKFLPGPANNLMVLLQKSA